MSFRLFGVNVEVRYTFWIMTVFLGASAGRKVDVAAVAIWTALSFFSILAHEYGHAFAVKAYGLEPEIRLHHMGGTTHYRPVLPLSRAADIVISLAGPFAGFFVAAIIVALDYFVLHRTGIFGSHITARAVAGQRDMVAFAIVQGIWINFFWGLINLIPVLPLDGGHVLEALLGPKRTRITAVISLVAAIGTAVVFFMIGLWFAAILFAFFAHSSLTRLQSEPPIEELSVRRPVVREAAVPGEILTKLRSARRALAEDDLVQATILANEAVRMTGNYEEPLPRVRLEAYEVLGWAAQLRGEHDEAARWVKAAQQHGVPDAALIGAVLLARGEIKDARKILEAARAAGDDRKEIVGPLIQILIAEGEVPRAAAVAYDIVESLSEDDARQMAQIAFGARAYEWSARLYESVFERTVAAEDAYEAARAYAADGAHEKALECLSRAVAAGFSDAARAWSDAALEPLRSRQKLQTVVPRP
ncbi:MAG: site-2 protease family protein [Polyangiaceae bacterium]|nr:site-2 protease family protein [Polyangiaceae bacterium]